MLWEKLGKTKKKKNGRAGNRKKAGAKPPHPSPDNAKGHGTSCVNLVVLRTRHSVCNGHRAFGHAIRGQ